MKSAIIVTVVWIAFWLLCVTGYVMNIVKFVRLDFNRPYKAEIVRGAGFIPFVGSIVGYLNIND